MKKKRRAAAAAAAAAAAVSNPAAAASSSAALPRVRKRKRKQADSESEEPVAVGPGSLDDPIQTEWDFREPDESDFHAVKDLLVKPGTWEFAGEALNLTELTDSMVNQGNIGTILKAASGSDDETCTGGIHTVLNLRQFSDLSWPKAIQNALLTRAAKHGDPEVAKALKDLLGRQGKGVEVGLLFSERMANLPVELVPPMHKALKDDIEWSCTTPECPEEERPFYFFTHLIGVARCFLSPAAAAAAGLDVDGAEGPCFLQQEFQAYVKRASWSFTFRTKDSGEKRKGSGGAPGQAVADGRTVFLITRKALDQVVKDLKVNESNRAGAQAS